MAEAPPTLGIDARAAAEEPAGRGRYVRELLRAAATLDGDRRLLLYCREPADLDLDERFRWVRVASRDPLWHLRVARRAGRECDAFLSTNSYLTLWFIRCPAIAVVYDLIPFRPGARAQRRAGLIERLTIRPALRRAAQLVCISEATRRDLEELFPRARGRTAVVPLAASPAFARPVDAGAVAAARERHGVPTAYVLTTATLEPRKNLERLVQAHASLPDALRSEHPLVVCGPRGWEEERVLGLARRHGAVLTGFVPDADLAALYQGCTAFCYPSLYEGFGLPVLEAMSMGAPTITSSASSLPEVAGDAALLVDPLDPGAIAAALKELLTDSAQRERLAGRGRGRAAEFSWTATARAVLRELESVA